LRGHKFTYLLTSAYHISALEVFSRNVLYKITFYITLLQCLGHFGLPSIGDKISVHFLAG